MKLIVHASSESSLARARACAKSTYQHNSDAGIILVANLEAVRTAVESADAETDRWLVLCERSLRQHGLDAPAGIETTVEATLLIAKLQRKGWAYMHG